MMHGSFDHCRYEDGTSGFLLQENGVGVVWDSVFTGMQAAGLGASAGPPGTSVELNLENCLIAHAGGAPASFLPAETGDRRRFESPAARSPITATASSRPRAG